MANLPENPINSAVCATFLNKVYDMLGPTVDTISTLTVTLKVFSS